MSELASRYKVHFSQIAQCKTQSLENAPLCFERGRSGGGGSGGADRALLPVDRPLEDEGLLPPKKLLSAPASARRGWVEHTHPGLSISRQCALLDVSRSSVYYTPNTSESQENLALMRLIDEEYFRHPFYGVPSITHWLKCQGYCVNHKRVARLMRVMGLQAAVPGPHTSKPHPEHTIYPYLLRDLVVSVPDAVWCADITYIPMRRGFMYLVAVMDWFSRYVLTWELSNTLETGFCTNALERALESAQPAIFNTDQGSQFTSAEFTGVLLERDVRISMDGRGRAKDNIFIERLWRTVKYEDIYLREYDDGHALHDGLSKYFHFYNHKRSHGSLGKQTPALVYASG